MFARLALETKVCALLRVCSVLFCSVALTGLNQTARWLMQAQSRACPPQQSPIKYMPHCHHLFHYWIYILFSAVYVLCSTTIGWIQFTDYHRWRQVYRRVNCALRSRRGNRRRGLSALRVREGSMRTGIIVFHYRLACIHFGSFCTIAGITKLSNKWAWSCHQSTREW